MAAGLTSGRKIVTAGGTAEPLVAVSVAIRTVWIMAETDNTNPVVVGGADVVAALATRKGVALRATDPPLRLSSADGIDELSDIYVDAVTNGDGVTFVYAAG